jgi:hypothetical protein
MWSKKTRKEYLRAWGEYDRDERHIPREAAVVADMTWYDFCWAVRRQRWRDEQRNAHIREASLQALPFTCAAARPTEGTTPGKRKFIERDMGCCESKPVRRKPSVLPRPVVHEIRETAAPAPGPDVRQAEHVWYWEEEPCKLGPNQSQDGMAAGHPTATKPASASRVVASSGTAPSGTASSGTAVARADRAPDRTPSGGTKPIK